MSIDTNSTLNSKSHRTKFDCVKTNKIVSKPHQILFEGSAAFIFFLFLSFSVCRRRQFSNRCQFLFYGFHIHSVLIFNKCFEQVACANVNDIRAHVMKFKSWFSARALSLSPVFLPVHMIWLHFAPVITCSCCQLLFLCCHEHLFHWNHPALKWIDVKRNIINWYTFNTRLFNLFCLFIMKNLVSPSFWKCENWI